MINKLKIGLIAASMIGSLAMASTALAADITFSDPTSVLLTGPSITLQIQAAGGATTAVVNTTQLILTVPALTAAIVISPDRYTLTNDVSLAQACNNSQNSVTITGPSTVTFTPTTVVCTPAGGSGGLVSGGGSSGGGGGGSSSPAPVVVTTTPALVITPPATVTTTINSAVSIPGCMSNIGFSTTTGVSCAGNTTVTTTTTTTTSYNFGSVTLKNGSKGEGAKELQRFLNDKLNLGLKLDGKIGPKTITVIKKWQKDHGLKEDGLIGAKTKAMMNAEK